ncbi:hypothetical protein TNCV_4567761 [Trichonephila clavipes]|nr:hypothetical protein TNCV_4567761 [Trichonephila clavipes]
MDPYAIFELILLGNLWAMNSRYSQPTLPTRGLLVTDLVLLNHGQGSRTTPELVPPSPNFHTTPTGRHLSFDRFSVHRPPTGWVLSGTVLKLMTRL